MSSSESKFLRKVLRDKTNRRILVLLQEKEALTSEELIDTLVVAPSLLGYHLSVLNDLVNKTVDNKYVLSEKGKQVYVSLSDLTASTGMSLRWKITWLISIVCCIMFFVLLRQVNNRFILSLAMRVLVLCMAGLIGVCVLKVNPESTGRLIYIAIGVGLIGSVLWVPTLAIIMDSVTYSARFPFGSTGRDIIVVLSIVVCFGIGGVVGELIGKKMKYKWPPPGTPVRLG
jgi:DNA-binding transcriptional ArsR family regulator